MFGKFTLASALLLALSAPAFAADTPGVTATEIKIGGVFPFSGPASSIGLVGKGVLPTFNPSTIAAASTAARSTILRWMTPTARRKRWSMSASLWRATRSPSFSASSARREIPRSAKYLALKGVPTIAIVSGSNKFTNIADYPLTTTGLVSFDTEGKIYAKYLSRALPNAKYAILYQNDDLGKDYVNAFKAFLKSDFDKKVVTAAYEISDPTVDSQVVTLKSSGAEALLVAGTPKFSAQAIRKVAEIGWKPTLIVNFPSSSVSATLKPAGFDNAVGVIVATFIKDPTNSKWNDDAGMKGFRAFFDKYLPGSDVGDTNYLTGYQQGLILEQILKQCGNDLSRENIVKQAKNLKDFVLPTSMPGISINTSATSNMIWTQLQLQRWSGTNWEQFGEVLDVRSE